MTALASTRAPGMDAALPLGETVSGRPTFTDLYEDYFAFLWRSALRLGTPRAHVDDVVQDAFIVVHRRLASFEGKSSVKTWLFGILFNVVRARRRAVGAELWRLGAHDDLAAVSDPAASPDENAARAEAARLVDRLLYALEDDKRAIFVLAELEAMSVPEIALALRIPLNTAYSRLRLARHEFAAAAARHRAHDAWRTR
jgi:RNA polymerase sigma-70 factor (ECF subfamily)